MRALWSLLAALLLLTGAAHAQTPLPFYDAYSLTQSLRASTRATLPNAAGLRSLDELPLYDLTLDVRPESQQFSVREELYFTNTEAQPLAEIVLRLYANTSRRGAQGAVVLPPLRVTQSACLTAQGQPLACTARADGASVWVFALAQPLQPGGRIRLTMSLEGRLDQIDASRTDMLAAGMESLSTIMASSNPATASASDYGLLAMGDGIACLAQFYPVLAPRRQSQWVRDDRGSLGDLGSDELANVRAQVSFPEGYRTVTTGVTVREETRAQTGASRTAGGPAIQQNPTRIHHVYAALVRDFTVLASRQWIPLERRVGDVIVRSHVLPAERASGERVLDAAAQSLAVYERRFGPYPYADLDVCEAAVVGGAGGVEFAGLVTIASMFYRPANASAGGLAALVQSSGSGAGLEASRQSMLEFVTAHEVAHQYWHGLVGSDSRDHPFVDEALAQYSAMLYLQDRYGRARAQRDGDANVRNNYHLLRALGQNDQAVNRPVSTFATPMAYAGIVYGKAPYFYEALRRSLGDAAFFRALQGYVRTHAFRMAPPNALIDAFAQGRQATRVRALATRWLEQTHGDEDLGRASLGQLAARMMGESDPARARQLEQMIGGLERTGLLQGLLGNLGPSHAQQASATAGASNPLGSLGQLLGGAHSGGATPATGGGSATNNDELMRTLMQMLGNGGLGSLLGGAAGGAAGGTSTPASGLPNAQSPEVQEILRMLQGMQGGNVLDL
ncbi:MAG: M1 family aminopeptidase [Deltaproteobacteria bacterium]|nr:M1 family aminopeptidase [Deltaproteobacteria bacterium]